MILNYELLLAQCPILKAGAQTANCVRNSDKFALQLELGFEGCEREVGWAGYQNRGIFLCKWSSMQIKNVDNLAERLSGLDELV